MNVLFAGVSDSRLTLVNLDEFSLVDRYVLGRVEGEAASKCTTGFKMCVRFVPKLPARQGERFKILALYYGISLIHSMM
jgi:hypothetical protein